MHASTFYLEHYQPHNHCSPKLPSSLCRFPGTGGLRSPTIYSSLFQGHFCAIMKWGPDQLYSLSSLLLIAVPEAVPEERGEHEFHPTLALQGRVPQTNNWNTRELSQAHRCLKDLYIALLWLQQGSSENDGRSDVYDRSEFKVISSCCYNNCCRTNCSHFYLYLPEYT